MLVVIGATPEGKKELLGMQVSTRESSQTELARAARRAAAPGSGHRPRACHRRWGARLLENATLKVLPATKQERCWQHKVVNVLNVMPKSLVPRVKIDLHDIHRAPTHQDALAAFDRFASKYHSEYEKAVTCLRKDQGALPAFLDFPAEHWDHLGT